MSNKKYDFSADVYFRFFDMRKGKRPPESIL